MKQFEFMMLAGALCLTACADHPEFSRGGVGLSDNQISFSTNTVNGWQGLNGGSRAAVATGENKPLKMESSLGHALYLHPIEQSGTYIYNSKDELITRSGALLPNDGNLLANNHHATTRGSKYNDTGWSAAFGVSAILTNQNTSSPYFQNQKATPSGGSWLTNNPQYWPTAGSLSFYAYAPYCDDSHSMLSENADKTVTNAKTVHYVASPTDIVNQPDLIVANHLDVTHGSKDAPTSVGLTFSHVLTAITFAVGSDMVPGTVKSIAIKGVKNTGDYDLSTGKWTTSGNDADFTISLESGNGTQVNGTQDVALTSGDQTLMMIPQTFDASSKAKVEIVFTKTGGQEQTLSASLANTSWDAGSTIIYKVSTSSLLPTLTLNKVTFPTDWSAQYAGNLKSTYSEDDKIGLYVVAPDGKVRAANVLVTYKKDKWSFPTGGEPHINTNDKVFAYYPYQRNPQGGLPSKNQTVNVTTLADANAFFKSLEDAWMPQTDQSTIDNMNASDLQVANAILSNTGNGLDLTMAHTMGLADITLGSGIDYRLANDHSYMWHDGELVSNSFTGRKLNKLADDHYIAVVKSGVSTTISASSNDVKYAWKSPLEFNPSSSEIQKKMAEPKDHKIYDYTLELGDIYYSDGALTHQADNLAKNKTPIGIVGYIDQNKWTEHQTGSGHGGHALVMCLLNTDSYGTTPTDGQEYRPGFTGDYGTTKVTTPDMLRNSYDKDYGSGYINTAKEILANCTWAEKAKGCDILVAPKDKSTGWFLPTAGQFYAFYSQIGGGVSNKTWRFFYDFIENSERITTQIDNFLSKVGNGKYLPLGKNSVTALATSTEYNADSFLSFQTDWCYHHTGKIAFAGNGYVTGTIQTKAGTGGLFIRPFLAF